MIVLDASLILAWLLEEDTAVSAPELTDILRREELFVPTHWIAEVGNSLLVNQRRGRIPAERVEMMLDDCDNLDLHVEPAIPIPKLKRLLKLGAEQSLTIYDAAYLIIALDRSILLGTLDQDLRRAAKRLGVATFPA